MMRVACAALALLLLDRSLASAQSGELAGIVIEGRGRPVSDASVSIIGQRMSATTLRDGRFFIPSIAAGHHRVIARRVGYLPDTVVARVLPGQVTRITLRLGEALVQLQGIVISVSRRAESQVDAPATVVAFTAHDVAARIGNSYLGVLKDAAGLSVAQVGVTNAVVNARGFNRLFNTRWLTLEDGRIASLPETGLPVGEHTTVSKLDVDLVEVVVGPGSALYGANASNGVLSVRTKDPRSYPGWSSELSIGTRNFIDAQARFAGGRGNWGYKISGGYQAADEWTDTLVYAVGNTTVPERTPWNPHVARGSGSLTYYLNEGGRVQVSAGASDRAGLRELGAGRQRVLHHRYDHFQLEYETPRWYANAYVTHSNTGDTYFLFTEAQRSVTPAGLSRDSIRSLSSFRLDGRLHAVEIRNNFIARTLRTTGIGALDDARITWGAQMRRDRVSSYGLLYLDRVTGQPIYLDTPSGYLQLDLPLSAAWRIVTAGRYDAPDLFDPVFSPKAALVYSPASDQTFRVSYNKAYSAPGTRESQTFNGRALAGPRTTVSAIHGLIVRDLNGNIVNTISPIRPEGNQTWEVGYKSVIAGRFFADVTGYRSRATDFISNLVTIADPYTTQGTRTQAYNARTGDLIADANGNPLIALTYYNVGSAVFHGLEMALRYALTERVSLRANSSLARVDTIVIVASAPDASLFNSSSASASATIEVANMPRTVGSELSVRYVNGYDFRSGLARGHVPTYGTLDLSMSYRMPSRGTTLMLQATNIASCVSGESGYPASGVVTGVQLPYTPGRRCGIGIRHRELLFMPAVGPMIMVGARREWP